jgi:hypothetical protein
MNNKILQVITVNGVRYLIDKDAEIKKSTLFLEKVNNYNIIRKCLSNKKLVHQMGVAEKGYKIVAIEYPNELAEVSQFKLPDEDVNIEKLANLHAVKCGTESRTELIRNKHSFIAGYKANKSLYTEEDVVNFLKFLALDHSHKYLTQKDAWDDYKQSLHKNNKIESVEIETYCTYGNKCPSKGAYLKQSLCDIKPKLDEDGLLVISKINWNDRKSN